MNTQPININKGLAAVGTFLLWALVAGLGILSILALQEMILSLYVLTLPEVPVYGDSLLLAPRGYNQIYWRGVSLTQWGTFLLAILWMGITIGGAEYLYRNYGQPQAWKFLFLVLGLELVILIMGILI